MDSFDSIITLAESEGLETAIIISDDWGGGGTFQDVPEDQERLRASGMSTWCVIA